MTLRLHESWKQRLVPEFELPYFKELTEFVRHEYEHARVYPAPKNIFRAFELCPFDQVKVVILGQDPYHGPRQANGLCFSVSPGVDVPPSLVNIFKEISEDLGTPLRVNGDLDDWAQQGVLLLNATLTVRAHQAGSHQGKGWETFTDAVIRTLNAEREGLVFLLWGKYAMNKAPMIDASKHLILTAPHPSPLSAYRGFFGCKHFSQANAYLKARGEQVIVWG